MTKTKLYIAIASIFASSAVQAVDPNVLQPFNNYSNYILSYNFRISSNGLYVGGDTAVGRAIPGSFDVNGNALTAFVEFDSFIDISNDATLVMGKTELGKHRSYYRKTSESSSTRIDSLFNPATSSDYAKAISADGRTVVGFSIDERPTATYYPRQAFIWTRNNGVMGLGYLDSNNPFSMAEDVSADGSVIVGVAFDSIGNLTSFMWQGGVMTALPTPVGQGYGRATNVSDDGNVIMGIFTSNATGQDESYIWTRASNRSVQLQRPSTMLNGNANSIAMAGDGQSAFINVQESMNFKAFRWTQSGTALLSDWITSGGIDISEWSELYGVSSTNYDGKVILGSGLRNGQINNYIVRVESNNSGLVVIEDVLKSVQKQSTISISNNISSIAGMAMNGAHHLTLTDMAVGSGENCAWGSFDIGRSARDGKGWVNLSEVGACKNLGDFKFGLGVGFSSSSIGYDGEGRSKLSGQYLVSEINWTHQDSGALLSALGIVGNWNADIRRDYTGTSSFGDTDVNMQSLRLRADFKNLWSAGDVKFTPVAQMTVTRTRVGNYQETGGTAPAQFDTQSHLAYESRLGLNAEYALSSKNSILGRTEWVKRFDSAHLISGSAMALGAIQVPFNFRASEVKDNWMRAGFDVIYKPTQNSRVALSATASTPGQDADYVVGLNWTGVF